MSLGAEGRGKIRGGGAQVTVGRSPHRRYLLARDRLVALTSSQRASVAGEAALGPHLSSMPMVPAHAIQSSGIFLKATLEGTGH